MDRSHVTAAVEAARIAFGTARAGKRVGVFVNSENPRMTGLLYECWRELTLEERNEAEVLVAHGSFRIFWANGGSLSSYTNLDSFRGYVADAIFFPEYRSDEELATILPALSTTGGQMETYERP